MSQNPHLDRRLSRGCFESMRYATGRDPIPRKTNPAVVAFLLYLLGVVGLTIAAAALSP